MTIFSKLVKTGKDKEIHNFFYIFIQTIIIKKLHFWSILKVISYSEFSYFKMYKIIIPTIELECHNFMNKS